MKLYELSDAYKQLLDRDDVEPQTMVDTLNAIKDSLKVKADNIASLIDQLNSDANRKDSKAKAWRESATHDRTRAKWLQTYLTNELDHAGIKKLETDSHILSVRNYKASVYVDDPHKIPVDYVDKKVTYKPNKKRIYEALKAGKRVEGVELHPNRKTLIK